MARMAEPLAPDALNALAASKPPLDAFGPGSDRPLLAIHLPGTDGRLASWCASLPCPIIGIGQGPLAGACDVVLEDVRPLHILAANVARSPIAAMVLVQHLRSVERLSMQQALWAESMAFATLQQGPEFRAALALIDAGDVQQAAASPLRVERADSRLDVVLDNRATHNAIDTAMRDALCEALELAIADPEIEHVRLTGTGRLFSSGGELREFGSASDPASAHLIRSLRSPALLLASLQDRLRVHVNGGAIGAGAELAAFAHRLSSNANAWFQLPELKYGLIPGAGGTVSLTRRIGRQRTAYLALSMRKISAQTALDWGLVDEISP